MCYIYALPPPPSSSLVAEFGSLYDQYEVRNRLAADWTSCCCVCTCLTLPSPPSHTPLPSALCPLPSAPPSKQGDYYWFEIVQMGKKMLLTGALVLLKSEEGLSNILVGILVCLFYLLAVTNTKVSHTQTNKKKFVYFVEFILRHEKGVGVFVRVHSMCVWCVVFFV